MKNNRKLAWKYLLFDFVAAAFAWLLFYATRKLMFENVLLNQIVYSFGLKLVLALLLVPSFMVFVYYFSGFYKDVYRKTVGVLVYKTFVSVFIGVVFLFFFFILDDVVRNYHNYYMSFIILFSLQFVFALIPRIIICSKILAKIHAGVITFKTIIIGNGEEALNIFNEIKSQVKSSGNQFVGYLYLSDNEKDLLRGHLSCLGDIKMLPSIIKEHNIEDVIIAIKKEEQTAIFDIVSTLELTEVKAKAIPDLHMLIKSNEGLINIMGTPLIEINLDIIPVWQQQAKQVFDVIFSLTAITLLSPFYVLCALGVKLTSKGPIFFRQERIGKYGKPFILYKFRSMHIDAEKHGPNLASKHDKRLTTFGRFLRRSKLDEIPNFWNVLIGDMSLVGYRPERKYYIDQITQIAPHYIQLQKIKPGITSLGQVKFGYAENVEQMVKRLRYDVLYMENMSIYTDLKILFYTFLILFKGRHI